MSPETTSSFKTVLDVVAVLAASAAFSASAWQAWIARRHNRLTVRPALTWTRNTLQSDHGVVLTFAVVNNGVGPAFVRERFFTVCGDRWTPPEHDQVISALVTQVLGQTINYQVAEQGMPGIGAPIAAGARYTIAKIVFPGAALSSVEALLEHVDVHFCARYECLYDITRWVASADHLLPTVEPSRWSRFAARITGNPPV